MNHTLLMQFYDDVNKLMALVDRSEAFAVWAYELHHLYRTELDDHKSLEMRHKYMTSAHTKALVMQINLYFQESLLCLHSVIKGYWFGERSEISLETIINKYKDNAPTFYESFKSKSVEAQSIYTKGNLDQIRNDIFAHKNLARSGDSIMAYLNPIKKEFIDSIRETITYLRGFLSNEEIPVNNGFLEYFSDAFENVNKQYLD